MDINEKVERAIVTALVEECAAAGFVPVKVWDGGEYVKAKDVPAVLEAVFSVGTPTVHFAPTDKPRDWGALGVLIVTGNGEDCISDYHCGDPKFTAAVEKACKRIDSITVTA